MDSTFSFGRPVLVLESRETTRAFACILEPFLFWNRYCILGVTDGWIALVMERMVGDLVLVNVVPAVLKSPVCKRVYLCHLTTLVYINEGPFKSVITTAAVDHAIALQCLQSTLERLDFANTVVLLNVHLPEVSAMFVIVFSLISTPLGLEPVSLESIAFLGFFHESDCFVEQVESVDEHNLGLPGTHESETIKKIQDDHISSDHRTWEHGMFMVLNGKFKGLHCLGLEVIEALFFRFCDHIFNCGRLDFHSPGTD
mmetsp:Transcript_32662/g.79455  ORF Transcript_32662/g.79455 Transcript_32662/m.79455 type:complete len:256 (+) Transcript_32662:660-1427(+)